MSMCVGYFSNNHRRYGFTLIELLIVIAIVAVLAVTVILTLNPAQLLAQARDTTRLSDLAVLNKALATYKADVVVPVIGSSSVVYVSLPDSSPTCASYELPGLPAGWSYACRTTSTRTNVDGTGWVPVNFNTLSSGSPLSALPVDPTSNAGAGLYYTYVATPESRHELTTLLESEKRDAAINDGDAFPSMFSIGSARGATPVARDKGLVGYWPFDEGSGTTVADMSSNGNHGTWSLSAQPLWTAAKVGSSAGNLYNASYYVNVPFQPELAPDAFTVTAWVKMPAAAYNLVCWHSSIPCLRMFHSSNRALLYMGGANFRYFDGLAPTNMYDNAWHFVAITLPGSALNDISSVQMIVDGVPQNIYSTSLSGQQAAKTLFRIGGGVGGLDDVRLYNRVLSGAEINAIYEATR